MAFPTRFPPKPYDPSEDPDYRGPDGNPYAWGFLNKTIFHEYWLPTQTEIAQGIRPQILDDMNEVAQMTANWPRRRTRAVCRMTHFIRWIKTGIEKIGNRCRQPHDVHYEFVDRQIVFYWKFATRDDRIYAGQLAFPIPRLDWMNFLGMQSMAKHEVERVENILERDGVIPPKFKARMMDFDLMPGVDFFPFRTKLNT